MISNWGMFNIHENNNTLLIKFLDEEVNSSIEYNEVKVLKHDNDIVGYEISDFIRYAKIKYSGIIFMPHNILVDVINSILENNSLEKLEYKKESGYIIKEMPDHKIGVYAKVGTFLRDEHLSKGRFCSYYDLFIDSESPNDLIILEEKNLIGHDFFLSKEN